MIVMHDQSASGSLTHQILGRQSILRALCLLMPTLPLRVSRTSKALCETLSDENVSNVLSEVFGELDMFHANPFKLARDGDVEKLWLLFVHGVDPNIVGNVRFSFQHFLASPGRRNPTASGRH